MDDSLHTPSSDRREFFKKASAILLGGVSTAVPVAAGVQFLLDPLGRKAGTGEPIRVTTLDALPVDGVPRQFAIVSERFDVWNRYPPSPIGAVYLRRVAENKIEALHAGCPHAGCFVDYAVGRSGFLCPCHNSRFALDGKIADDKSPSPRSMDTLEVEVRNGNEVWVKFQNFRAGHPEKVPVA